MGEGTAEREAPAFMPGRTSRKLRDTTKILLLYFNSSHKGAIEAGILILADAGSGFFSCLDLCHSTPPAGFWGSIVRSP